MSTNTQTHDPTAQGAHQKGSDFTPQEKIETLLEITKHIGTGMLTSRSPNGRLASRAMAPATTEGLVFSFYMNTDSGKTDDIETDPQVNVSFYDPKTTDWVSISGQAVINKDQSKIKKHWSSSLKSWFDDKKDGKHTGDHNDPRVVLLDVQPEEIRVFKADGKLKALGEMAKAAVSGHAASAGKLLILTSQEIQLAAGVYKH
ncbi:related to blue-light-inducible Bli-3 protein [Melanopsichium pennsylvanicum]|uniref:Related to blue-light-inducible Bli-3 protein n=2 Tax=Melanopsichium pennsylvanicum TaxID=63383 RepID=A0AAJ4XGD5_9BASI|nr:related to blue-light-inducible Bli-3 protein [Melanopsichium pennsylvanicum 4]SNX82014.1 related to blue-light-inducible Bli-3 protein [Melanopsichium pennsylvanicum]